MLRSRTAGAVKVTNIELFFDLVFVYAVTQLSHTLLHGLNVVGALQVLLLFLAVWWVWVFTSWVTNWLDPERPLVRLLLLALMLAGLLLSMALPEAFGERGLLFAGAYVFMQVGRTLFVLWALGDDAPANTRNFQRIAVWLAVSGALWLLGGWLDGKERVLLWVAALALEYIGPALAFAVPGLGRSSTADWDIDGGHLAERCSLFVIIALGESVLVTGSSFAATAWQPQAVLAFVSAFVGSVAMWWIYFDLGAERGSRAIRHAADPGRTARAAYTYLHLLIVAGIIVGAVADELTLRDAQQRVGAISGAVLLGGPMLYLTGNAWFKKTVNDTHLPLSHLVGLGLLAVLAAVLVQQPPSVFVLGLASSSMLVLVAAWETVSLRHLRRRLHESSLRD
ncbi:low temperature requirement protein A [Rhodanobacter sp. LX-100]|nr:low temperature requirement protein A [Rhodanobacter sp. LX-99]MBT2143681.1 low temperature requirement protein A [Rhodanobacter sp. LX-99]MBT2147245.1 low temperature requirement protein A [Rhodanobacter sp. LX-100]